jgi:ribose transport system substrate-binding protein
MLPVLARANRAAIPVVVVDERLNAAALAESGVRVATFVGSDNVDGGRLAGRHLLEVSGGRARVAVLEGIPGHESGDERLRGFREAIAGAPGIVVVASQTANWERDQGFNVFQNMLQAHPDIDAVFACNDVMALGAVEAIAAAGRAGRIRVIGFDATEDGRKAIGSGAMDASIAQFPSEMGRLAVESAATLIQGGTVPSEQPTKVELITRANLAASR